MEVPAGTAACVRPKLEFLLLIILFWSYQFISNMGVIASIAAHISQIKKSLPEFYLFRLYRADTRGPNVASIRLNYRLGCGKSADCTPDFPRSNCRSIFPIYCPEYDLVETSLRRVLHFQ